LEDEPMKKLLLAAALIVAVGLLTVGCGKKEEPKPEVTKPGPEAPAPK
jgi:hypothetical protein